MENGLDSEVAAAAKVAKPNGDVHAEAGEGDAAAVQPEKEKKIAAKTEVRKPIRFHIFKKVQLEIMSVGKQII